MKSYLGKKSGKRDGKGMNFEKENKMNLGKKDRLNKIRR